MEDTLTYLRSMVVYDHHILQMLDQEHRGREDLQPFIEPEIGKLLSLLIRMNHVKRVLELGTGIGYSTIWIACALRETGGRIVTIDNHRRTNCEARSMFAQAGCDDIITLIEASAEEVLPEMAQREAGTYHMVFQDGGKQSYPLVYEDVCTLLAPGGILIADDVLFPAEKDVRRGLKKPIEQFTAMLLKDSRFYTSVLPIGHGAAVSIKKG